VEPRQDVLPLDMGTTAKLQLPAKDPKVLALRAGWPRRRRKSSPVNITFPTLKTQTSSGTTNWYEATGITVPFPGDKKARSASDFNRKAPAKADDDD